MTKFSKTALVATLRVRPPSSSLVAASAVCQEDGIETTNTRTNGAPDLKLQHRISRQVGVGAQTALQASRITWQPSPPARRSRQRPRPTTSAIMRRPPGSSSKAANSQRKPAGDQTAFAKGQAVLKAPIDALIANPRTPQKNRAQFNAIQRLTSPIMRRITPPRRNSTRRRGQLGYQNADLPLQIVRSQRPKAAISMAA